jgi:hypothetical protein
MVWLHFKAFFRSVIYLFAKRQKLLARRVIKSYGDLFNLVCVITFASGAEGEVKMSRVFCDAHTLIVKKNTVALLMVALNGESQ